MENGIREIEDIDKNILKDFKRECNEDLLKRMIENFKKENILTNCTLFAERNKCFYRDNLYRTISINIDNLKVVCEKNLVISRCFYSLSDDKDVLDMIYDILERRPITQFFN